MILSGDFLLHWELRLKTVLISSSHHLSLQEKGEAGAPFMKTLVPSHFFFFFTNRCKFQQHLVILLDFALHIGPKQSAATTGRGAAAVLT